MSATMHTEGHPSESAVRNLEGSPDSRPTDESLLLGYRSTGDNELFAELVRRYENDLFRYLCRMLANAAMAQDTVQATFLALHLKCGLYQEGRPVRPWLFRLARNQAIDALRRAGRHRMPSIDEEGRGFASSRLRDTLVADGLPVGHELEQQEASGWVQQAVAQLSPPLQEAITLVFLQNLRYREAAASIGVPLGTLKSRLHTAVKLLRTRCPSHLFPEGCSPSLPAQ